MDVLVVEDGATRQEEKTKTAEKVDVVNEDIERVGVTEGIVGAG